MRINGNMASLWIGALIGVLGGNSICYYWFPSNWSLQTWIIYTVFLWVILTFIITVLYCKWELLKGGATEHKPLVCGIMIFLSLYLGLRLVHIFLGVDSLLLIITIILSFMMGSGIMLHMVRD